MSAVLTPLQPRTTYAEEVQIPKRQPVDRTAAHAPTNLANLDLLRCVAVLLVGLAHLTQTYHNTNSTWWQLSQLGVLMFFVHTALVLMWSAEREKQKALGDKWVLGFYIRRVCRIYPLAIMLVLALYFGHYFVSGMETYSHRELLSNLTLTQNLWNKNEGSMIAPLWTLPLEIQMYAVLPLFLVLKNKSLHFTLAAWVIALAGAVLYHNIPALQAVKHVPLLIRAVIGAVNQFGQVLLFAPVFIGGILAWRIMRRPTRKLPGWLWPVGIGATSAIWLFTSTDETYLYRAAGFGLVLGATIPWFKQVPWGWVNVAAKTVAQYSYSFYLAHVPIQVLTFHLVRPEHRLLLCILVMVVLPVPLYHFIEKPGIALGKKIAWKYGL